MQFLLQGLLGDGEGKRDLLFHEWAALKKILKFQPLDDVRDYFGVKVALYFAWLGFYTNLLIVPSCVGVICFIYGLLSLSSHIPSQEICKNETTTMCPACDQGIQGRYRHRIFLIKLASNHICIYILHRNKHFFTNEAIIRPTKIGQIFRK